MHSTASGRILVSRDEDGLPVVQFGSALLRRPPERPLELGVFPLAPSIRIEATGPETARIRLDPFAAFPLFIAGTPPVIGDSLPEVGAHADATGIVDPVTVVARIAFESEIGPETLLAGVRRMLPAQAAEIDFATGRVSIVHAPPAPADPDPLSFLVELVGTSFREGADLELTAGYDSRLVLALGLASGTSPRTAITMGAPDSFDVQCASRIARKLGLRHLVIPFPEMDAPDWEAVRRFWMHSGCALDPLEYAWTSATFGTGLPGGRTQLSGLGGEIACGFYAFKGDETLRGLVGWRQLIRHRMAKRRKQLASMGSEGERLLELAVARALARVQPSDTWRDFGVRMYVEERCRSWAGSLLTASSTLYRAIAPLLTPEYRSLGDAEACRGRGRGWQHQLIGRLEPRLLGFPFRPKWSTLRKVFRRWSGGSSSGVQRPDPRRDGDERVHEAFELGCLQLGWRPEIAAAHPGTVIGVGWLEMERIAILRELNRQRTVLAEASRKTG